MIIALDVWTSLYWYIFSGIPQLNTPTLTTNTNASITVSGIATEYVPDSYFISYYCQCLCGAGPQIGNKSITPTNTSYTHTISEVYFGATCIVNVTAVFNNVSSNTVTSSINTTTAGILTTLIICLEIFSELRLLSLSP